MPFRGFSGLVVTLVAIGLISGSGMANDAETSDLASKLTSAPWQAEVPQAAPLAEGADTTLTFGTAGELTGSAGCNRLRATYEFNASNSGMTIQVIGTTRKLCAPAVMQLESDVLKALRNTVHVASTADGGLVLRDAEKNDLLSLRQNKP